MNLPSLPPAINIHPPRVPSPAGACDTHFHVIGPRSRFPFAQNRAFTPDDVPLEWAIRMHDVLGMTRGVVVQCNPHGTDNSALLEALARYPDRLRGSAIVNPDISRGELKRMVDAGVRALRFHHMPMSGGFSPLGMHAFQKLSPVMSELGLHAQFMMDANAIESALPYLRDWNLPVVIDHMGNVDASLGVDQPAVMHLCDLLDEGRIWVKVSGAYRISSDYPDYDDARAICEAFIRANDERILWGSDWPHTRLEKEMPEDGHLLDLFNGWTPHAAARQKILVENPQKLYGFT